MAHNHNQKDIRLLNSAGVAVGEDLFATVPRRFAGRWRWLLVNLIAAVIISRVVGIFEPSIAQLVALASLMPIVAGMSGNIGNQTATMTVRALVLGQINPLNWRLVLRGEMGISVVNSIILGWFSCRFCLLDVWSRRLGACLVGFPHLLLFCASLAGFMVPLLMQKLGKDPALGTTVVLAGITDILGFLYF